MTTLQQLPQALTTSTTDLLLVEQSELTAAVTLGTLLEGTQAKLTLASGALLGRVSVLPGPPEPIGVGNGLTLEAGLLTVDGLMIASLDSPDFHGDPTAPTPPLGDNSTAIATTAFVLANTGSIAITGDMTGAGSGNVHVTLPTITSAGTFTKVTINAKGQVTTGGTLDAADLVPALGFTPYDARNPAGYIAASVVASFPVLSYGAFFDGVHDDYPGIAAAIAAANAAGGGDVIFPASLGLTSQTIVQPYTNVRFTGGGVGALWASTAAGNAAQTTIRWTGPAGGTICVVGPPNQVPPLYVTRTSNCDVTGINFDCAGIAAIGIQLQSVENSTFELAVNEANYCGIYITTSWIGAQTSATTTTEVNDVQGNHFPLILSSVRRIVQTTVSAGASAGTTIAVVSTTGFVGGMRTQIGTGFYQIAPNGVAASTLTFTTSVSSADATSGNSVMFAPWNMRAHAQYSANLPAGYVQQDGSAWASGDRPRLSCGNVSGNTFDRIIVMHYAVAGDAVSWGYSDHNQIRLIYGWLWGADANGNLNGYGLSMEGTDINGEGCAQLVVDVCGFPWIGRGVESGNTYGCYSCVVERFDYVDGGEGRNSHAETGASVIWGTDGYQTSLTYNYPGVINADTFNGVVNATTLNTANLLATGTSWLENTIIYEAGWEPITGTFAHAATSSLVVVNNSSDHVHFVSGTGGIDWQVRVNDGTGCFELIPVTNTGSIRLEGTLGVEINGPLVVDNAIRATFGTLSSAGGGSLLTLDSSAGDTRLVAYTSAGKLRWEAGVTSGAETGSNVGGDWTLAGFADDGATFLNSWLTVTRANGAVTIPGTITTGGVVVTGALTAPTPARSDNSTSAATTAWVTEQGFVQSVAGSTGAVSASTIATAIGLAGYAPVAASALSGNAAVQVVATIAALRSVAYASLANGCAVMVLSYGTSGDGGAGLFVWSSSSAAADNGGISINPTGNSGAGRWVRQLADGRVTPQMFGAKGDGSTNDTAAFNAALASGVPVAVPNAIYRVADVIVPTGAYIEGCSGLGYSYEVYASPTSSQTLAPVRPILAAVGGTTSCILNVYGSSDLTIKGLFLDGGTSPATCDGISSGSTQMLLERVTVTRCINGLGSVTNTDLYTHVAAIIYCEFCNNTNGISNLIDSNLFHTAVSANTVGINLGSGAGANTFLGGRYEWNTSCGMQGYQCASNMVIGGLFDRNSGAAVNLGTGCADFTFNGVQFNRNGANNTYPGNAHIQLNGTASVVFLGCVSQSGNNNAPTGQPQGNTTPAYFIEFLNANAYCVIEGTDCSGYMTGFSFGTNPTQFVQRDNIGAGANFVNAQQPFMANGRIAQTPYLKSSANITPGQSATFAMTQAPFTANYSVFSRTLNVTAENFNSPYQQQAASFKLMFDCGTSTAFNAASAAFGECGGTGVITWGTSSKLGLAISSVASNGSAFTLTVTNNGTPDGSNWGVWAELE